MFKFKYVTILLSCLMSISSLAQIIIEERVEINPLIKTELEKQFLYQNSDTLILNPPYLIMWKSGFLQINYGLLIHFYNEVPSYSSLNTFFYKDDSTQIDSVKPRFPNILFQQWSVYDYCDSIYKPASRYWCETSQSTYLLNLGYVEEGDTVKFNYISDLVGVGGPHTFEIKSANQLWSGGELYGWMVTFTQFDECIRWDLNLLQLIVRIRDDFQLLVDIQPEILAPGDTADIIIQKKMPDGSIEEFDTTQTFEVGMLEGCMSGTLLAGAPPDTGSYFYGVHLPIKFAATDSLVGDTTGLVKLRVGIVDTTADKFNLIERLNINSKKMPEGVINKIIKTENPNLDKISLSCFYPGFWQTEVYKEDSVIVKKYEILLGETKYYQAKRNTTTDKLAIEEITPDANGVPQQQTGTINGWEWLTTDVWGNNPVSVVECDSCGEKMGVYWEKEKPIFGTTDTLQIGLIRLVGRYWHPDSTYIVLLSAKKDQDSTFINIEVKKPAKLLSEGQSPTYSKSRDVLDNEYSVDSLCITFGGIYGIPPQLIKGHIKAEAPPMTFGGYSGFAPSYRYEPYTTQFRSDVRALVNNNNQFIVSGTGMGTPGVPTSSEHQHVKNYHYYESVNTVWDIVEAKSQLVNENNPNDYGYRWINGRKKGQMSSRSYKIINTKYEAFLDTAENEIKEKYGIEKGLQLSEVQQVEANDSARTKLVEFLKYEWDGNVTGGQKGLDSIYAQTRVAASYSLLQNLYPTALNEGYETDIIPENLNLMENFKYNIFYYTSLFKKNNGFSIDKTNNWISLYRGTKSFEKPKAGFEEALRVVIYLWNTGKAGYYDEVFQNMKNFLSRR